MSRSSEDPARQAVATLPGGRGADRPRREAELARKVKGWLTARALPAFEGADLESFSRPGHQAGGDFFDVMAVDQNRWGILLGQASGSGYHAALSASVALSYFRSAAPGTLSPAELLSSVNNLLFAYRTATSASITAAYAIYDVRDRTLLLANAGQCHPLLNGRATEVAGLPLGLGREARFPQLALTLKPGESLVWYTSGIASVPRVAGDLLGLDGWIALVREQTAGSERPWALRDRLEEAIGDSLSNEDVSFVAMVTK